MKNNKNKQGSEILIHQPNKISREIKCCGFIIFFLLHKKQVGKYDFILIKQF